MLQGYIKVLLFIVFSNSQLILCNTCDYICNKTGCIENVNYSSDSFSNIKYCAKKDIPDNFSFSKINENEISAFPATPQIYLKPPKNSSCKYKIILLANGSVNKKNCENYTFNNFNGNETHSRKTICFISNGEGYKENNISIHIPYIFTGCYSIIFQTDEAQEGPKGNEFIETNYSQRKFTQLQVDCTFQNKYNAVNNTELFVRFYTPTIVRIRLMKFYEKTCISYHDEFSKYNWYFNLKNGRYKHGESKQIGILPKGEYCIEISVSDIRCQDHNLWNPSSNKCTWYKRCKNVTENINHRTETNFPYVLSAIVPWAIVAIIFVLVLLLIIYIYNVYKRNIYRSIYDDNIRSNKIKYNNSNVYNLINTKGMNADIILLYPKESEAFMAVMAELRDAISRVCQCVVHDWYDAKECNYVAENGVSDWFSNKLKDCRVIWIDTPRMRSLITQKFRKNSFVKIGDFRDVGFSEVFKLSKRIPQSKHFIVRITGYEDFESDDDPFGNLSLDTRYLIPQNLTLLYARLSTLDLDETDLLINKEVNVMKHHLHYLNINFCK